MLLQTDLIPGVPLVVLSPIHTVKARSLNVNGTKVPHWELAPPCDEFGPLNFLQ